MKKIGMVFGFLVISLLAVIGVAQENSTPNDGTSPLSMHVTDLPELRHFSDKELEDFMKQLAATPQIPFAQMPRFNEFGGYFSLQHPEWPPLPGNINREDAWRMEDFYLLNDMDFDYDRKASSHRAKTSSLDPADADGSDTNTYPYESFFEPDYSTNLWIAQPHLTNNFLAGIGTNTIPDVQYEIQSRTNLAQTDWQSEGFILGSETTNWTPLSVAKNNRTNLFLRLRSWADDGSGLPTWWQQQYFGTNGVDPYGNPAGDGWSNFQKFQNGWNPTNFYTPAAPQGLQVTYKAVNNSAAVSWNASAGSVTNYQVRRTYEANFGNYQAILSTNDYMVQANVSSVVDGLSALITDVNGFYNGYDINYQMRAGYAGGQLSPWTPKTTLRPPIIKVWLVQGGNSVTYLAVANVPTNTATIRLYYYDYDADYYYSLPPINFTNDIPISSFTNGYYALPDSFRPPDYDAYGPAVWGYAVYAQAINSTNALGGWQFLFQGSDWTPEFHDARRQLKDNLIFQLRVANTNQPFHYYADSGGFNYYLVSNTASYLTSGYLTAGSFNDSGVTRYYASLTPTLPYEQNYLYRNFAYDSANLDSQGKIKTGLRASSHQHFLSIPPTNVFQAPVGAWNTVSSVLSTNQTRWLAVRELDTSSTTALLDFKFVSSFPVGQWYEMLTTGKNCYGLPFVSTVVATNSSNPRVLYPGDTFPIRSPLPYVYYETAQPQFQTVEYDFWDLYSHFDYVTQTRIYPPFPEAPNFSVTNKGKVFFTTPGTTIQIDGYAKMIVSNGYTNKYCYLGQYFDQAYKADANGNTTTNATGYLSGYGDFFAIEQGQTALVTMPDPDSGQRGTAMVYCVSLNVDKNHDGVMDLSFKGADVTSPASPMQFWVNNNYDRVALDGDDQAYYEDDVPKLSQEARTPYNPYSPTPDSDYQDAGGSRIIPTRRDLEDFSRLWLSGLSSNLVASLPSGTTVALSWANVSGNPTIDLFAAADTDGGIGYLTNSGVANLQKSALSPYLGRLEPSASRQLNIGPLWPGEHFIWCGVNAGNGALTLTISDANSNVLVQSSVWIEIKDIKQMYERWTVGDDLKKEPFLVAVKAVNDMPTNPVVPPFEYTKSQDTNTPYILFVHGWNMTVEDKDRFAETAFKRLYWQGYQGRFGSFRWPTGSGIGSTTDAVIQHRNFDDSEFNAWRSGLGLKNMLTRLNILYPGNAYLMAHSMGNVVAGEALKLAGTNQLVNCYVAMQGAVASHAYDTNTPTRVLGPYGILDSATPDRYAHYFTNGAACYFNASSGAETYVNFFNTNDFALDKWQTDQNLKYDSGWNYNLGSDQFERYSFGWHPLYFPTNTYEIFAYCDEARCYALGAQANVGGKFFGNQVKLPDVWPPDPYNGNYTAHLWHSAQFRADTTSAWQLWRQTIVTFDLQQ